MQSPTQPVSVHSCPLPQHAPSAWQMHSPFWQVSERGSAVQSTQMPKPQVVSEGSMHLLPRQQPAGQECEVHSSVSSPQAVNSSAEQKMTEVIDNFT
jgi:hypothetical protein